MTRHALLFSVLASSAFGVLPAHAQNKPPVAQFWMDVATHSLSIPGMEDMPPGMGGMMGGFFGSARQGGAPGQWLDEALYTRLKPAGTEGNHAIPPGMNMGVSLPLVPPVAKGSQRDGPEDMEEKPKGRLLFYWGCGATVRPGQPKVLDFSQASMEEWGRFMQGRHPRDRGARALPGHALWPNERDRRSVPPEARLAGGHAVGGSGVPAGLQFELREPYEFMPQIRMSAAGDPRAAIAVAWQALPTATGYFLTAMGARGETEMIFWSSSEQPDPGFGLMDYVAPAQVKKLIGERVALPPERLDCQIPAGIFANVEGAMVRMIAYGPELNLAHPPRPADPKVRWEPDWAVRVRIKSTGMTVLGEEAAAGGGQHREAPPRASEAPAAPQGGLPGIGDVLKGVKGIFGN